MAAHCTECEWTGTSSEVVDGGRCPDCAGSVMYRSAPLGSKSLITSTAQFNRRALIAMRGLDLERRSFMGDMLDFLKRGMPLTDRQQQALINAINSKRRQITDVGLLEYAAAKARGHDQ